MCLFFMSANKRTRDEAWLCRAGVTPLKERIAHERKTQLSFRAKHPRKEDATGQESVISHEF